uniref:TIMELESS-interacting protein n=2 Tax=Parascaris univalens TaxID=6257 RepID=A0A915BRZ7_PARUN
MDEVEDSLAESVFGGREPSAPTSTDENAVPTDEQLLNDLFKKGDKAKAVPKRRVLHPQPKLNEQQLCGPKGLMELKKMFDNYTPNPKKNPYENLADIMNKVEYWAHLLHPKLKFDDFIARVETLGDRRMLKTYMEKMRLGMPLTDDDFTGTSKMDAEPLGERNGDIESESDGRDFPTGLPDDNINEFIDQFYDDPASMVVAGPSRVPSASKTFELTEEQRQRIMRNKQRAEELRKKREGFLNRLDIQHDEGISSQEQLVSSDLPAQESASERSQVGAKGASNPDEADAMNDEDALDFIFSSE